MYDMSQKSKRINARVTEEIESKLAQLVRREGSSMSDVIAAAIERYYAEAYQTEGAWYEVIKESGLVGCGEGPEGLSSDYKERLSRSLGDKFGYS